MAKANVPIGTINTPPEIENADLYAAALKALSRANEQEPMATATLVEQLERAINYSLPSYKIYQQLLGFTRTAGSKIGSRKGRGGGYFILPDAAIEDEFVSVADQKKEKTLEKHLWPIVAAWLSLSKQIELVSSDVANIKAGGVWSNPDVVGLNVLEALGFFDVEITTVEVKPTLQNWKYFFFEAVSHKRFSERVYFIYRDDGSASNEQRLDILRYAEKYGVGVVEVQMDDSEFDEIRQWSKLSEQNRAEALDKFVELVPAPFEAISVRDKIKFLEQLGINSKADLYSFGQ